MASDKEKPPVTFRPGKINGRKRGLPKGRSGPREHLFKKGISGNPGGRPKEMAEAVAMCQRFTPQAVEVLKEIALDNKQFGNVRVAAASYLLDRALGKPKAEVEITTSPLDEIPTATLQAVIDAVTTEQADAAPEDGAGGSGSTCH